MCYAQVGMADVVIVEEHLTGTFQGDLAGFHDIAVMRNLEGVIHVLTDQQNGHALARDVGNQLKNFIYQDGTSPSEGSSSIRS